MNDQCEAALREMLALINRVPVNRWRTSSMIWIDRVHANLLQRLTISTLMRRGWITWTDTAHDSIRRAQLTDRGLAQLDGYVNFADEQQWHNFLKVAFRVDEHDIAGGGRG
jgi:hypothetical protein